MINSEQNRICLIAGLGNPGDKYNGTRHNVGFDAVTALLENLPGSFEQKTGFNSIYWKGRFKGHRLILQKPMTFMNLSGEAVSDLAEANKILPSELILIYDDMDLPLGKIRIRKTGSSAGHRGAESVIEHLHTEAFPRIRIGIGRKSRKDHLDHVLSKFHQDEQDRYEQVIKTIVDAVLLGLSRGIDEAMNRYNGLSLAEAEEKNIAGNTTGS